MPVYTQKFIFRSDLKSNPSIMYLFGDNVDRKGLGGQAKEMRGEPNASGVATKRSPSNGDDAFFSDDDYPEAVRVIFSDLLPVVEFLKKGGVVIIPEDGLGTGLSELPTRAPKVNQYLESRLADLRNISEAA